MLKSVLAATLMMSLLSGCYVESARATTVEAPAVEEPFLLEQPEPSIFTGDLEHDRPLVCASRFNQNLAMVQMGMDPASDVLERYAVEHFDTIEEYQALYHECEMFDLGITYYILLTNPPQPEKAPSRWDKDPRGVETRFNF